jgi:hypothetical protein
MMMLVATADGSTGSRRSTIGSARIERLMKLKTTIRAVSGIWDPKVARRGANSRIATMCAR